MAANKKEQLEAAFNLFDKDASGKIEAGEIKSALREYYTAIGEPADEGQLDADVAGILKECDSTKDGKIDKAEWFKYFEKVDLS